MMGSQPRSNRNDHQLHQGSTCCKPISGGQAQGTPGRTATVRVPILTNSIPLERGDRLFFQISKPKVEKKQESWVKAARDEDKKRKKEKDEVAAKGAKKMKGAALSLPGTSSKGNVRVV